MRKSEYTEEQIIEAGNTLLTNNERVTAFGIRNIIGGGNASRIGKVWEEYISSQNVAAPEVLSELPVDVSEKLEDVLIQLNEQVREMANQVNHVAVTTSERRVAEAVREARERQESAEAELKDAAVAVDQLEEKSDMQLQEIEQLKKQLADTNAQLKEANNKGSDLAKNLSSLQKDYDLEKGKSAELAQQLLQKTKECQQQAVDHKDALAVLKAEHKAVVDDLKVSSSEAVAALKGDHKEAVTDLKAAHSAAIKELKSAHSEAADGLAKQVQMVTNDLSKANDQIAVLHDKHDAARSDAVKLLATVGGKDEVISRLETELEALKSQAKNEG